MGVDTSQVMRIAEIQGGKKSGGEPPHSKKCRSLTWQV